MPPSLAHPGLHLGPISKYTPGPGTHLSSSQIYASLAGPLISSPQSPSAITTTTTSSGKSTTSSSKSPPQLSVQQSPRPQAILSRLVSATNTLPVVNDIVIARVTRLQTRQATLAILVVGESVCADAMMAVVRREDVRGWEIDKVVMGESMRVGDLVRGVVISLGDQASYYLSTAKNELGVIMATSEEGNEMYPISWKEFRDPVTGKTEGRKAAKPI